ncbi:MAG: enoyl-CoA hydratase/isomerase family protein [Myxococcota bacterium]|nr:enoyl-CoA hydratase/isomerase family protein [Myxococcota bacterium]
MESPSNSVEPVTLNISGHLASVRLSNPPGNRFTLKTMKRMCDIAEELSTRDDVRVVWLSAEGEDFCQGADLKDAELAQRVFGSDDGRREVAELGYKMLTTWSELPMPTVVSARGRIIGAGAGLVTASDFRVMAAHSALHFPEVDRGMYLSWGIIGHLTSELGPSMTRRLAVAGVPCPCEEFPPGFCKVESPQTVDDVARAQAMILTAKPPLAVRSILATTRALSRGQDVPVEVETQRFCATTGSSDFKEAIQSWLEGRPGRYQGE